MTNAPERVRQSRPASGLKEPIASFSHAVRHGPMVFVGAKGSIAPGRAAPVHPDEPGAQADRVMENALAALAQLDGSPSDVVEVRAWLTDWRWLPEIERAVAASVPTTYTLHISHSRRFPIPGFLLEVDLLAADQTVARGRLSSSDGGLVVGDLAFSDTIPGTRAPKQGSMPDQAEIALERLDRWLSNAGVSERGVVQVTVALAEEADPADFVRVWRRALREPRPPCVLTRSRLRDPAALVELRAIASAGPVTRYPLLGEASSSIPGESSATATGSLLFTAGTESPTVFGAAHQEGPTTTLSRYLAVAQRTPADLIRVHAAVRSWDDYGSLNRDYDTYVVPPYPARTTVQAALTGATSLGQLDAVCAARADDPIIVLTGQVPTAHR